MEAAKGLKRRWWLYGAIAHSQIIVGYLLLRIIWDEGFSARWCAQAVAVMLAQWLLVGRALPQNHRLDEEEVLPDFGPGNLLSLTRGVLIANLAGFLLLPRPEGGLSWLPAILYILSDFTDFFDGYLARISNHVTRLGETLDMNNDSLGVLVVTALAFQYGTVPWWYLPFGFARFVFLFGLWLRGRKNLPVYDLRPSVTRRMFAGLQMGFITVMLFPVVGPPATTVAATIFLFPFLTQFAIDYLRVTGRQWPDTSILFVFEKVWPFVSNWLPVGIRLGVALTLGMRLGAGRPPLPTGFAWVEAAAMALIAAGILGRATAVVSLVALGAQLRQSEIGLTLETWVLIVGLTAILFLGTGRFSLWSPEDWMVYHRAGERASE